MNTLLYEVKDQVGFVTVNKPETLNALNSEVLDELYTLFSEIENDDAVKAVILTGAGRAFVAGADIAQMSKLNTAEIRELAIKGQTTMNRIDEMSKLVIAAVNGFALGGGNELAMACDIRFASDKAKFGQPEVNLGILPFFGGTQRLSRLVGQSRANYIICGAAMIDAQEAFRIGLADKVVPADDLLNEAEAFARLVMTKSPIGVRMALRAISNGLNTDLRSGLVIEVEATVSAFCSEDRAEGMAAFLEKREPVFFDK